MATRGELVFIPSPGAGHLVSAVEIAKLLVDRDGRLSVTVLVIKLPTDDKVAIYTESLAASTDLSSRIKFVVLPDHEESSPASEKNFISIIADEKNHVREAVSNLINDQSSPDSPQLAGFVLDMFCMCMTDVADQFELPSYIFYTSSASALAVMLHSQDLYDQNKFFCPELTGPDAELKVPGLAKPVPTRILPSSGFNKEWLESLFEQARMYPRVKGIMVNTVEELESYAFRSFSDGTVKLPPVYAVGPIMNITGENYNFRAGASAKKAEIMTWLDGQPDSSVVFLCFGSMGSFGVDQVKLIARALEQSGYRFLWSLRRPAPKGIHAIPSEYVDLTDALPEGFLDRTSQVGKVVGWVPQVAVLGHPAVGGFVSHCGWNSTLESLWFGVPIATWPMYAEQQLNAFQLVVDWGLAVEIKMDYRSEILVENPTIVSAEEIEGGIRRLMEPDSEMRNRVKEMKEKGRGALMNGGSSFSSLGRFIEDVLNNISQR